MCRNTVKRAPRVKDGDRTLLLPAVCLRFNRHYLQQLQVVRPHDGMGEDGGAQLIGLHQVGGLNKWGKVWIVK